jgi:release factor glutamine methyltransferase
MGVKLQTIKDIRPYLAKELEEIYHGSEISSIANLIIKTVIRVSRLHQLYMMEQIVTHSQSEKIIYICKELKTGKPIQYILGETIFYDCIIRVTNATLIPRPETEELVDLIIEENRGFTGKIIDIGAGSGCITIALAANMPGAIISGIDTSEEIIGVAKKNALLNNVTVSFMKGDIFNFDFGIVDKVGIVVSNPPYILNSEKQFMGKNVLDFEPHTALFVSDSDPLMFYKAILKISETILLPGGRLYFEINEAMGRSMVQLLEESGYLEVQIIEDINGKERIIKGIKNV